MACLADVAGKYCTAEPFLEGEYDLRIQRIAKPPAAAATSPLCPGHVTATENSDVDAAAAAAEPIEAHYRVFRRMAMSGNWKTNTGTSIVEEVAITPAYRRWADLAAGMFGGL